MRNLFWSLNAISQIPHPDAMANPALFPQNQHGTQTGGIELNSPIDSLF
jgi:hypothetical protein